MSNKACCCIPTNCNNCPIKNNTISPIEINSAQTNINQYNRYPFKNIDEAIYYMKQKRLLPGEIAIGYYYTIDISTNKISGIDCILGIGNLKNNDVIIKY